MRTVAVFTLGCKVNQVESEQIKEDFLQQGYQVVEPDEPADVYVINTCTVTHVSDRKSRAVIRRATRRRPEALVVVTGCMAQLALDVPAGLEGVGLVVGNRDKDRLAQLVESYLEGNRDGENYSLALPTGQDKLRPVLYGRIHKRTRAFVKIQDGCQSFCSYCIVPYVRGSVRSKLPADVISELRQLVALGYREIVLTGIHCGMYGLDLEDWDLTRLIRLILEAVPGEYRIRIGSIEPLEVKAELLELVVDDARLCCHFHIPLQSGSDRILELMHRRYRADYYRQLVEDILRRIPEAGIAADVMVGFPGENQEDFAQTYALLRELPLLALHVFKYSLRPGTKAASLGDTVPAQVKQERSERLINLAGEKHDSFIKQVIGKEFQVLAERKSEKNTYLGFTDNYIEVEFAAEGELRGELVRVRLTGIDGPLATAELI